MNYHLSEKKRRALVNKVLKEGLSISQASKIFKVSRPTIYKWINSYQKAEDKAKAFENKKRAKRSFYNKSSPEQEEMVRWGLEQNPKASKYELSGKIKEKWGDKALGPTGVYKVLKRMGLNEPDNRITWTVGKKYHLNPQLRKTIVDKIEEGRLSISEVSRILGVSRPTIYKWMERYEESFDKEGFSFERKRPLIDYYARQATPEQEKAVQWVVIKNPRASKYVLANIMEKNYSDISLSASGIYKVLKRMDLNLPNQRIAYSQAQQSTLQPAIPNFIDRVRYVLEQFVPSLAPAPPPSGPETLRARGIAPKFKELYKPFFASALFTLITVLGTSSWIHILGGATSTSHAIGLVFASIALLMGSFFFAYSMKYYLTLAIVLSFSQQEGEASIGGKGKKGFLYWLLGIANGNDNGNGNNNLRKTSRSAVGLEPNLEHIKLKKHPYISVHIPFYNEKNVVERAMAASTNFDYKGEYEVILCDDSTDGTKDIIRKYQEKHLGIGEKLNTITNKEEGWTLTSVEVKPGVILKHLHRASRSGFKGGALKLALTLVDERCEFISVFDADFVPYPDTLELFLKYFKVQNDMNEDYTKSNVAVVQGYQWHVLNKSENWITRGIRNEYAGSYVIERSGQEIYGGLKHISGSVYMIRRKPLEEAGWDTSITEDYELTLKLYEKGYKVVYTPYIQAPAECVSTLKRLIKQRMRWAEGHSHNVRKMWRRLLFNSKLTIAEKVEFLYNMPYYLQAFFFLVGTFSWLISETIFPARLPFWTTLWGWSLVLTNMLSLPLVNAVGLFLEESEQKDYQGIPSFIALSYIIVPFQAYASVKGFLEREEGPWFRTPKTGKITDVFARGKFYRFISGILPGRSPAISDQSSVISHQYIALATANNRFNTFNIKSRKQQRWLGKLMVSLLLLVSTTLVSFAPYMSVDNNPEFVLPGAGVIQPANANGKRSENTKNNKNPLGFSLVREAKAATNDTEGGSNTYIDTSFRLRTEGLELKGDKKGFQKHEDPQFTVNERKGIVERIKGVFKKDEKKEGNLSVRVINNRTGKEIEEVEIKGEDKGGISVSVDADKLYPGKYSIIAKDNEGHGLLQDFTWGVLALNTNKPTYAPEETVNISFAVLNEKGGTECNAELELSVKRPNGDVLNFSTEKGTIVKNGGCGHKEMILLPDYETFFSAGDSRNIGVIELSLTAKTINGEYSIEDSIEVRESVKYDIERLSATRLYPPLDYPMIFTVTVNEGYEGIIMEEIPASFNAREMSEEEMEEYLGEKPQLGLQEYLGVKDAQDKKMIEWFVNWEKGKTYNFGYWYKAPAMSPAFFLLGKLKIGDFKEARYWQIALDAVGTFTEKFEYWEELTAGSWQTRSLSSFSVPANSIAEIAFGSDDTKNAVYGGVRSTSSTSLDRRFQLGEAESGPNEIVVMHVNVDGSQNIQNYAESDAISFWLLGYWDAGTYVEKMTDLSEPSSAATWEDLNLSGEGVSAGNVAEIVLTNSNAAAEYQVGVRENVASPTLARLVNLHEAENGGVSTSTMLVQADNTANATIEIYEANLSSNNLNLVGYWSDKPGTYHDEWETITAPTADGTWQTRTLSTVTAGSVTEILLLNGADAVESLMGVRPYNDGTLSTRYLNVQEAEDGGRVSGRMHTKVNSSKQLDIYHEDYSDTPFEFQLVGYWELFNVTISGNIYQSGSESTKDTGNTYTVSASVNNGMPQQETSITDGDYSIGVVASSGNTIAVYIDNHTNNANTFTVTNATNISNLHLYIGRVAVGNNNAGSTTNANICNQSTYPKASTPDDKLLSCDGSNNITVEDNAELHVLTTKTYAPGANLITGGTGDLHLDTSAIFTGAGTQDHQIANDVTIGTSAVLTAPNTEDSGSIKVGGSWDNSGIFTEGAGEVIFTATSGTETINNATSDFYDLTLGETSGSAEWDVTSALDVDGDMTLAYGTLDINTSNTVNVAGLVQFDSGTTYSKSTGAFTFDGTGSHNYTDSTAGIQNLGNVTIDAESSTRTVSLQTDMEMNNLTIEADGVFAMGTNDVTIGNTTDASVGDINVTLGGASSQSASGTVTILSNSGTTQWNGTGEFDAYDLTIGNSSNIFTINNNNLALDIANDFTITANAVYQASSTGKLEVGNHFVNSGTFTKNQSTVTMDGQDAGNQVIIGTDSFYNLTFDDAGTSGTFSFTNSNVTVSNDFKILGGSVTAPSGTLSIGHDFTNDDIFSNNTATVDFNAASDSTQTISGTTATTTFNNLTVSNSDKVVVFGATKSYTISGALTMGGIDCLNFLVLRSTVKDSAAIITNTVSLSFIDTQDITYGTSSSASNSVDSGGNSNISIAANSCVGASTNTVDTATGYSFQRKTFYNPDPDDYWLFYHDGDEIEVRYSANSGTTWTVENDHLAHNTNDFSIWNATVTSNYVFMAVAEGGDIVVRRGTVTDGSIGWDSADPYVIALTHTGSEVYSYPFISVDSSGYLWVGAKFDNGSSSYSYKTVKSSNTADSTWTQAAFTWGDTYQITASQASSNVYGNIVPLADNNMYATFTVGTELLGCKWVNTEPDWQDSSSNSCTESVSDQFYFRDEGADVLDDTATDPRKEMNTSLGSTTQTETIDTTNRSFYILTDNSNKQWTNDNLVTTNTSAEKRQIDSVTDADGNTVSVWADSRNSGSKGTYSIAGTMNYARDYHASTLLADGRVFIAGSYEGSGYSINEIYDPVTGTYKVAGTINYARYSHQVNLLHNGKVLISGSAGSPGSSISELFDPATGTYTVSGTMTYNRNMFTTTLLVNGKVLMVGAFNNSGQSISELYDPATETHTIEGTMNYGRYRQAATLLHDGRVFITGSASGTGPGQSISEIFNPATGTYEIAGTMNYTREYHDSTLLHDGRVLLVGSHSGSGYSINELYDPSSGTYEIAGTMNYNRNSQHTSKLLPNGKVLITGSSSSSGTSISELFDPATGTYTISGTMTWRRNVFTSTLLPDGRLLMVGSDGTPSGFSINEIYDPETYDIYAQKTNSSGAEQWTAGGVKVNSDDGNQDGSGASLYDHLNPSVDIDDNGDAIVAWEEYRNNVYGPDIYSQKLQNSNGDKLWPKTYTYPGTFSNTGTTTYTRYYHTSTLLADGRVLVAGTNPSDSGRSISELYDPTTGTYTISGTMTYERFNYTSNLLPNGKVLIAGTAVSNSGYSISELYDPATGTFTISATTAYARAAHTSTLLADGKVLLAGSVISQGQSISELYNPSTGTFTISGTMTYARDYHTSTLLSNGKVLSAGTNLTNSGQSISELYDPATGTYTISGTMTYSRYRYASTLLSNGKVLSAGTQVSNPGQSISELYDPATGTYTISGTMTYARNAYTSTLLSNGKVFLTGTQVSNPGLSISEIYDPSTGTFTIFGTMNYQRYYHTSTLLANGKVLLAGTAVTGSGYSISELYDTSVSDAGTFAKVGTTTYKRYSHKSTLLKDGRVLLTGTSNATNDGRSISELYDPSTGTYTISATMTYTRAAHTSTLLSGGRVLVAGTNFSAQGLSISELYDPISKTFTITGTVKYVRYGHSSTLLSNGKVLLAGTGNFDPGQSITELYNPSTGTFAISATMTYQRYNQTSTLLSNGKVLIAGSNVSSSGSSISELYNPFANTFTITGTMTYMRYSHASSLLPNGKVLLTGTGDSNPGVSISELYNPSTGTFTIGATMTYARNTHSSSLLKNGKVLVAGTAAFNSGFSIPELYDPSTGTFTIGSTMSYSRYDQTSTLLGSGKLLMAGTAWGNSGQSVSELYTPNMDIKASNDGGAGNWDGFMNPYYPEMKGLVGAQKNPVVKANGLDAYIAWEDDRYAQIIQNKVSFDYDSNAWWGMSRNLAAIGVGNGGGGTTNTYGAVQAILGPPKRIMAQKLSNYNGVKNWGDDQERVNRNNPEDLTLSSTGDTNSNPALALNGTDVVLTWDTNSAHENENGTLKRESNIYTQKISKDAHQYLGEGFTNAGTMIYARTSHSSILLTDGRVLLVGGGDSGSSINELYDSSTGTYTLAGTMTYTRRSHSSILLTDGRILITGTGSDSSGISISEIYDPVTGTYTISGTVTYRRNGHTSTLLAGGRVLITGSNSAGGGSTISEIFNPATGTFTTSGTMSYIRDLSPAVLLPDGRVLVAGHYNQPSTTISELFDQATGTFTITGTTKYTRYESSLVLLPSGKVLIVGTNNNNAGRSINELYDPATGTWTLAGTMNHGRDNHTSTLLPGGRVLLVGAEAGSGRSINELYDPIAGSYSVAGTMNYGRYYHRATLLPNGRVLIMGSTTIGSSPGYSINELYSVDRMVNSGVDLADQTNPKVEVSGDNLFYTWQGIRGGDSGGGMNYTGGSSRGGIHYSIFGQKTDNPGSGSLAHSWPDQSGHARETYNVDGTMIYARDRNTSTLLANGKVLLAGTNIANSGNSISELYDPDAQTFTITGTMTYSRSWHTSTLLPSGKVLLAGTTVANSGYSISELYDPATQTFTISGTTTYYRRYHASTLLANGKVLIAGGDGPGGSISELYDPAAQTFTVSGTMTYQRRYQTSTLFPSGKVLLAGNGFANAGTSILELYNPATQTFTIFGTTTYARRDHTSTLLANGKVLLAGTNWVNSGNSISELYDPSTQTFTISGTMTYRRYYQTSTLLPNGKVLLAGTGVTNSGNSISELYDPAAQTFTISGTTTYARYYHTSSLLSNGKMLLVGTGDTNSGQSISELYNPEGEMLMSHDFALSGDQTNPDIMVDSSGDPIIAWQDNRPAVGDFVDSTIKRDWDIYMQKYDSTTGSPLWPAASDPVGYDSPYATMDIRVDTYRGDYGEHYSGKPVISGIDSTNNIYINWEDNSNVTGAAEGECGYSNTDSEVRICGQKYTLNDQTTEKDVNWYVKFYASGDTSPNITVNTNIAEWDGYQKAAINSGTQTFTGCSPSCATPTLQTLTYTDDGSPGPPSDTVGNITMRRLMVEYTWNSGGAITVSYDDSGVDSRLDIGAQGTTDSIDSLIVSGVSKNISTIADSSYNVHVVYIDDKATDEVAYKKWNGTAWDETPQTIDTSNDNAYVSLSYQSAGDELYTVYARGTSLYYKTVANGDPWSGAGENDLATTGTNTNATSSYSSAAVFAEWTVGTASPFAITTNIIVVPEFLWLFMPVGAFLPLLVRRRRKNKGLLGLRREDEGKIRFIRGD